jgi:hypothetical protein
MLWNYHLAHAVPASFFRFAGACGPLVARVAAYKQVRPTVWRREGLVNSNWIRVINHGLTFHW